MIKLSLAIAAVSYFVVPAVLQSVELLNQVASSLQSLGIS